MVPIKLLVTDLDNTLLRRDKVISEYTKSVFTRLREAGVLFGFATARTEGGAGRFARELNPDILITNGGAMARYGPVVIYKAPIPEDCVKQLIGHCVSDPHILQISLEADNGYFSSKPTEVTFASGWLDADRHITTDFSTSHNFGDVYKFSFKRTDDDLLRAEFLRRAHEEFPMLNAIVYRDEHWHTFLAAGAAKERALQAVSLALGVPMENIAAFGDDANDVGMLGAVGLAVAMSNAIPAVKAVADHICDDCDNDGVARWIDENVLKLS